MKKLPRHSPGNWESHHEGRGCRGILTHKWDINQESSLKILSLVLNIKLFLLTAEYRSRKSTHRDPSKAPLPPGSVWGRAEQRQRRSPSTARQPQPWGQSCLQIRRLLAIPTVSAPAKPGRSGEKNGQFSHTHHWLLSAAARSAAQSRSAVVVGAELLPSLHMHFKETFLQTSATPDLQNEWP